MTRPFLALALAGTLILPACGDSGTSPSGDFLGLSFTGLPPLAGGFHYEGWAIVNGQPISTGKFNLGPDGNLRTVGGQPFAGGGINTSVDLASATAITITIEPAGDSDTTPAGTRVLAGAVSGRSATLTATAAQALGDDFGGASGVFLLATPTDGPNTNETSGIWFIDPSSGTPRPGLMLPALPAGWEYEGWTVIDGTPLTTGKFRSVSAADAAAPFSGPLPGPPFPGEDYLRNAPAGLSFPRHLGGAMAVITIEPSPDDSPMPFSGLRPLLAPIPAGATPMTPFALNNGRAEFARGMATF